MGKNDFMSPKAIGNRIKSKGLGKLRWYCQLCQKQCRDENGFKCHQMSDSHRRQMELFGHNPNRVVEDYSAEFEADFMDHLKRAHPFSRVAAKVVYNEYIADRDHVHMNSTKFLTLTGFVQYLGREGKCKVDETPKGWFITLIQKDPMEEIGEGKRLKRVVAEKEEEERHLASLQDQVARARKTARIEEEPVSAHELKRDELQGPLVLGLAHGGTAGGLPEGPGQSGLNILRARLSRVVQPTNVFQDDEEEAAGKSGSGTIPVKQSKLDVLMQKELEARAAHDRNEAPKKLDYWLAPGIVVKVVSKELKEHGYYKQKGEVQRVIDKYVGEISMSDSGDVVRVDQQQLETVIPSPGGSVLVVNGMYRGSRGTLMSINTARFQAQISLVDGAGKGREVWMEYEDICKLA